MAEWNAPNTDRQTEAQNYLENYTRDREQARADLRACIQELEQLKKSGGSRASIQFVEKLIVLIVNCAE